MKKHKRLIPISLNYKLLQAKLSPGQGLQGLSGDLSPGQGLKPPLKPTFSLKAVVGKMCFEYVMYF